MTDNSEYNPFSHATHVSEETQSIIERTRYNPLAEPILREVVQISPTSIVLKPIKQTD
jgi:hypothetical protein